MPIVVHLNKTFMGNIVHQPMNLGFWFPRQNRGAKLAEELRKRGHAVTVYHHLPIPGNQEHVRYVKNDFFAGIRFLAGIHHDIFFTSRSFHPVIQLRLNKIFNGSPYVYTLNGAVWAYHNERNLGSKITNGLPYRWLLNQALMGADAIVANSKFLAHELRNRFPTYNSKISTIYNGIDYDFIEGGKANVSVWGSGTIRILSVVTATYEKKTEGVHLLLEAFEIMCQRRNDLNLFIAAGTSRPNISEKMREAVDRLNSSNKVRMEFNRQDVPDLLAAADLFIYSTPSDSSDSLPRALLEAQAVGVPTVTTATTGCAEVVIDGETGRAVSYSPESVAEAALELIEKRKTAATMAEEGRQLVRARFNWEIMADAYEKIFLMAGSTKYNSRKLEDENEDL